MFPCVTVWLETGSPDFVSFVHALEWAVGLRLPIRCVRIRKGASDRRSFVRPTPARIPREWWPALRLAGRSEDCTLDSCADTCRLNDVEWVVSDWLDGATSESGLNVIGQFLPNRVRELLLKRMCGGDAAALICGPEWTPVRRVLLLNDARRGDPLYLRRAAGMCARFGVAPAVLTVAATEREARRGQQLAEDVLGAEGRPAHFDYVAGCDLHAAIHVEAICRRCSHVFMESESAAPRRRWGRLADPLPTPELSRSLTFLTLPAHGMPAKTGAREAAGASAFRAN